MKTFLQQQDVAVTAFDEALVQRLIEKVTVYDGRFVVAFRSEVMVDTNE